MLVLPVSRAFPKKTAAPLKKSCPTPLEMGRNGKQVFFSCHGNSSFSLLRDVQLGDGGIKPVFVTIATGECKDCESRCKTG